MASNGVLQMRHNRFRRKLARESGATQVVSGTYYLSDNTIQFNAQIHDMRNSTRSRQHVAVEPVSTRSDRPGEAIEALRQRVMGAMASIIDPRIEQPAELMGHMPDYTAYRAYIEGLELFWRSDFVSAKQHFQRAIELDSAYHLPGILLVLAHHQLREWDDAEQVVAHGNAEAGLELLAQAITWYKNLPAG